MLLAILFSQAEGIDYKHWTGPNWITAIWFNLICGNYLTNSFSYLMVIPRMFAHRLFKGPIKIWTEYLCTELSPVVLARGWIGHLCELFRLLGFMTLLSRSLAHTHTHAQAGEVKWRVCVWLRVCWYYWDQISLQEKFCVELNSLINILNNKQLEMQEGLCDRFKNRTYKILIAQYKNDRKLLEKVTEKCENLLF